MNATVEKFLFDLDFSDPSTVEEQLKSRAETRARETEGNAWTEKSSTAAN